MFDEISLAIWAVGPLIGLIGMFAGGYWGVGCGWLVVPSMLIMGLTPMEAVGVALLQMVPSTLPTVMRTCRQITWGRHSLGLMVVMPLGVGAFLASFSGCFINDIMYEKFGSSALLMLFAVVMVFIGLQTICSRAVDSCQTSVENYKSFIRSGLLAFGGGMVTGVFSSVLGIGGAVFMRPLLSSGFKVPERETSVAVRVLLLVTTFTGGITYLYGDGGFQWRVLILAGLISVGGMIGFPLGVKVHNEVAANGYTQHIHKSFAIIALIVICSTVLKFYNLDLLSRYVMIIFGVVLLGYLLLFCRYTRRHPRGQVN